MRNIIAITTTGTSLLTNTNNFYNRKYKNLLDIPDREIREFIKTRKKENKQYTISAEINSVLQLKELLEENKENLVKVHLILSDTPEVKKEIPFLKEFFNSIKLEVDHSIVKGLKYKESQFKMTGLRELIITLSEVIDKYGKENVVMNATGGFKAEIAYATVLAQLMHIRSYYIYESFNEIVPLPYLPLSLDYSYWGKYLAYFFKYEKGVDDKTNEFILKSVDADFKFLIEKDEKKNKWFLNPIGEVFYLSLKKEKKVYLSLIDEKKVFKKRRETTLWHKTRNINVNTLNDIPDKEVKKLLTRIIRFQFVKKIELIDYARVGAGQGETRLEYVEHSCESASPYVKYAIKCKDGIQYINILVERGGTSKDNFCKDLIDMLGRKVYP